VGKAGFLASFLHIRVQFLRLIRLQPPIIKNRADFLQSDHKKGLSSHIMVTTSSQKRGGWLIQVGKSCGNGEAIIRWDGVEHKFARYLARGTFSHENEQQSNSLHKIRGSSALCVLRLQPVFVEDKGRKYFSLQHIIYEVLFLLYASVHLRWF
jgi:hypothetical protein